MTHNHFNEQWIECDGTKLRIQPHNQGACLIICDKTGCTHFPLDFHAMTMLQTELDDLLFQLEEQEYDNENAD